MCQKAFMVMGGNLEVGVTAEEYWAEMVACMAEADAIALQITALQIRHSELRQRMRTAEIALTEIMEEPDDTHKQAL